MCAVSMIGDHYRDQWKEREWYPHVTQPNIITIPAQPEISKAEFDALKKEVQDLKKLLKRAKKYDEDNGEKDCEMDEKIAILKKVADLVGVDLGEIFKQKGH